MRSNLDAERQRPRAVQHHQRAVEIAHLFQAMQVDIARDWRGLRTGWLARSCCQARRTDREKSGRDGDRGTEQWTARRCPGCGRCSRCGSRPVARNAAAIWLAVSRPNWRSHRSSSQAGMDRSVARSGQGTGCRSVFRRIALTNPAAGRFVERASPAPRFRRRRHAAGCDRDSGVGKCPCGERCGTSGSGGRGTRRAIR